MAVAVREIIKIDEEKCTGCGLCIPACEEGALQIVDGKARLVKEIYCDGLGACLGECPEGALTIEERQAEEFDAQAVEERLASQDSVAAAPTAGCPAADAARGCPGSAAQTLSPAAADQPSGEGMPSALGNWPAQIELIPVEAPYLDGARLLIAADCTAFACADFHRTLLPGRVLLVGCPKLDDADAYRQKLAAIFRRHDIESIEIAHMEVPCCFGLPHLVGLALEDAGKEIPLRLTQVGVRGDLQGTREA